MIDISEGLCQGGGGGKETETQDWDRQKWKKKDKFEEIYGQYLEHQGTRYNHFPFNEVVRLKGIQIPVAAEPIFFCKHFVTDKLSDQIIFEINNYTQKIINSKRPLRRHSIINKWHPVDAIEP